MLGKFPTSAFAEKPKGAYMAQKKDPSMVVAILALFLAGAVVFGALWWAQRDQVEFVPKGKTTTTLVPELSVSSVSPPEVSIVPNDTEGCATRMPDGSVVEHGCSEQPNWQMCWGAPRRGRVESWFNFRLTCCSLMKHHRPRLQQFLFLSNNQFSIPILTTYFLILQIIGLWVIIYCTCPGSSAG